MFSELEHFMYNIVYTAVDEDGLTIDRFESCGKSGCKLAGSWGAGVYKDKPLPDDHRINRHVPSGFRLEHKVLTVR